MGAFCSSCSDLVDDINVNGCCGTCDSLGRGIDACVSKPVDCVNYCVTDASEHGCRQTGRRVKNRTVRCWNGVVDGVSDCFGSIGSCCDDAFCNCCAGACNSCGNSCNDFGEEICYVWESPMRLCYGDKKEITFALDHYIKNGENYPEDFKKLAKAKKLILTAEQMAVEENKRLDAEDEEARKSGKEVKRRLSTGGGLEDGASFDTLPTDFLNDVMEYAELSGALATADVSSFSDAVSAGISWDLIALAKTAGEMIGPYVPAPSSVGKKAASASIKKIEGREFKAKGDDLEKGLKPEENLTFKALEGNMLSRYQTGLVLERRPSCTAKPCCKRGCPNLTMNVAGVCTSCMDYEEHHSRWLKPYKPHPTDESSQEMVPKTLTHFREQVKNNEQSRDPKAKETKQEKAMREHVTLADLRREMVERSSEPFEVEDLDEKIKKGCAAVNYSIRYAVDPKEIGLLYDQFQLFDIDGDGVITLDDFMKVVSYISPELDADEELLKSQCQTWFGPDTFYPNYTGDPMELKLEVTFQMYVEAVLTFRIETEKHNLTDNLNFPFWSLRDCIVYCRPTKLDGHAYKRGSGNAGRWQKRHFRLVNDEGLDFDPKKAGFFDPRPTGSKACLVYDLDEEKSQGEVKQSRRIDMRDLYTVQFSPKTNLPSGKDVPKNLVCLKLSFGDQTRVTLACEEEQAVKWAAIFHRFSVGGKLITDWRLQYAGLSKNKITARDWINAGYTIYRMQSYLTMQMTYKASIDLAMSMDVKDDNELAEQAKIAARKFAICSLLRKISRGAPKLYCSPKERLILRVCNISENNLETAMASVQVGIKIWDATKDTLKSLDDAYLYSGVRSGIFVGKNVYAGIQYYKAAKVAYSQKRYATATWQPAGDARECAVCKTVFNSCSTKAEKKKHHCRSCGRIVCHSCSTHKIFFEITQKFKRCCDECLEKGKPPAAINVFDQADHESAVNFKSIESKEPEVDEDRWEDSDLDEMEFKMYKEKRVAAGIEEGDEVAENDEETAIDGEITEKDKEMAKIAKKAAEKSQ